MLATDPLEPLEAPNTSTQVNETPPPLFFFSWIFPSSVPAAPVLAAAEVLGRHAALQVRDVLLQVYQGLDHRILEVLPGWLEW